MAGLVRCSVAVEVKGRPLHPDKAAKEHGLRLDAAGQTYGGLPMVRVVGFKREMRFTAKDVRQVVASRLAEGRLAFVGLDGLQVVVTKAQPSELEEVMRYLQGSATDAPVERQGHGRGLGLGLGLGPARARGVATPMAATPSGSRLPSAMASAPLPPPTQQHMAPNHDAATQQGPLTPLKRRRMGGASGGEAVTSDKHCDPSDEVIKHSGRVSLCSLPTQVLDWVLELEPSEAALRTLARTCRPLAEYRSARGVAFRLGPQARGVGLPPARICELLERHSNLVTLDLSGFTELTAGATVQLAEVLSASRESLRTLALRGCKALSDVAVRRLLLACPRLEVLDLLEIPRLGNRALEAPLPDLRVLAAGSLGRPVVAERPRGQTEVDRGSLTNVSGLLGSKLAPPRQRPQGSAQLTSALLNRLSQRPPQPAAAAPRAAGTAAASGSASTGATAGISADGSASTGAPLTHIIFPNCAELETFPRLPRTLRHLDLRGASLQAPERALVQWQPLAGCPHLVALCLAGNTLLSSSALLTCLGSLPLGARLRVLDLSGTRAEAQLMMWLPRGQPALTHVRLAGCTGLGNESLAALFAGLHELEVLDVAGCPALEEPFAAVADAAAAFASAAPVAGGPYASAPAAAAASRLRLLGVGQTEFAVRLETTRGALKAVAPRAHAVPGSLDIFGGYVALPPTLL